MAKIETVERVFNKGNMMLVIRDEDGNPVSKKKPANGETVRIAKKAADEFASCFYTQAQLAGAAAQSAEIEEVVAAFEAAVERVEGLEIQLGESSEEIEKLTTALGKAGDEIQGLTAENAELKKGKKGK